MIDNIYIEKEISDHPVTLGILNRFPKASVTSCDRYGEIFNRKGQNFRLQKKKPALILAKKHGNFVLEAPENFGIGSAHNYYFSHMMNCIYDCRYCFLQGMYRSGNYVLFVNFQDFFQAITTTAEQYKEETVHFFSGYDCDSLALEPITHFIETTLPLFEATPNALLEIRTKSTQIRTLLNTDPIENVVVAYSLSPETIVDQLEHKTPSLQKRLEAIESLQSHGWNIGLRFDPLIWCEDFKTMYADFFQQVFHIILPERLHSVSLGSFRVPAKYFKHMQQLYPDEILFASPLTKEKGDIAYAQFIQQDMLAFSEDIILNNIEQEKFFPCYSVPAAS